MTAGGLRATPAGWPERLHALDVSRGLAALGVILWHWQWFAFQGADLPADFDRSTQPFYALLRIFYEHGTLTLDYFFALSGFVFFWLYAESVNNRGFGAGSFWWQRFSRLYPLHLVTLLLVAGLQAWYTARAGAPFVFVHNDTEHFVLNLLFASYWGFEDGFSFNAPSWSISVEVALYAAFFLWVRFHAGNFWSLLGLSVLAFTAFHEVYPWQILRGLAMFFLGGAIYRLALQLCRPDRATARRAVYAVTALCWALLIWQHHVGDFASAMAKRKLGRTLLMVYPYYFLMPATILTLALLEIRRGAMWVRAAWIGDITYATYLLHLPLAIGAVLLVDYGWLDPGFYLQPAALMLFFAVLLPISLLTYYRFELPMRNGLRRLRQRARSTVSKPVPPPVAAPPPLP